VETKLTLKLDTGAIKRAKYYIKTHKGNSLSKLVEQFFNSLTSRETNINEQKLPPIVSGLAGIIKNHDELNVKDSYTDYLIEKYK
jgi:hypothetical protein